MKLLVVCNLLILGAVITGIILDKSMTKGVTAREDRQAMKFDAELWRYIDIIISLTSLLIIVTFRKYIYIVVLLASLSMVLNRSISYDNDNHRFGDEDHVAIVSKGYLADGLIIGIVLFSLFAEYFK